MKLNLLILALLAGGLFVTPDGALAQSGSITGVVTDSGTGDAIENARVYAKMDGGRDRGRDRTDADGSYTIEDLEPGTYTVRVRMRGYLSQSETVEVVDGETATMDFALEEPTFGSISGVVTDADTGDPIENARVRVNSRGGWARTNADGEYAIEDVLAGTRTVRVWKSGYFSATEEIEVVDGEEATVDFALDPLTFGTISGVVTDAETGDPIEGARVSAGWWNSARTNADGEYTLEDVVTGTQSVHVRAKGYVSNTTDVDVVADETTTHDVALDALTFGTISGVVTDSESGEPIEGARVSVGRRWWNSARTNADGEYTIEDVVAGDQEVKVRKRGYDRDTQTVTVTADETTTHDVELSPR